ncbi:hypothetical protein [Paenibacillus cremeus]|uniref:Uncharacterized protein n=1 Tax=Paenibacillus cremeus TaxID=2163881 RepID=A0A559K548_9BACL|nr:hypothetical protein [Paenibacillus cremeus]TVY07262.1 hypothetical protein FPZ49_24840 [Paenibacillus cremeus]
MSIRQMVSIFIAFILFGILPVTPLAAQPDISKIRLQHVPVTTETELTRSADLIVYGHFDTRMETFPTGIKLSAGELVNYVQPFRIHETLKGRAERSPIRIVTDGVEPLPPPANPLNLTYTGPFAEGEYVVFLRRVPNTKLYSLVGSWQSIYPLLGGKLITLREGGFAAYNGLTVDELKRKVAANQ